MSLFLQSLFVWPGVRGAVAGRNMHYGAQLPVTRFPAMFFVTVECFEQKWKEKKRMKYKS